MKKKLFTLTTVIIAAAAGISFYLATLPNPTDIQKNLSNMTNVIVVGGATTIFRLLDDNDGDNSTDH